MKYDQYVVLANYIDTMAYMTTQHEDHKYTKYNKIVSVIIADESHIIVRIMGAVRGTYVDLNCIITVDERYISVSRVSDSLKREEVAFARLLDLLASSKASRT